MGDWGSQDEEIAQLLVELSKKIGTDGFTSRDYESAGLPSWAAYQTLDDNVWLRRSQETSVAWISNFIILCVSNVLTIAGQLGIDQRGYRAVGILNRIRTSFSIGEAEPTDLNSV